MFLKTGYFSQEYVAEHGDYDKLSTTKISLNGSPEDSIMLLYENFALSVFAVSFAIHPKLSDNFIVPKFYWGILLSFIAVRTQTGAGPFSENIRDVIYLVR